VTYLVALIAVAVGFVGGYFSATKFRRSPLRILAAAITAILFWRVFKLSSPEITVAVIAWVVGVAVAIGVALPMARRTQRIREQRSDSNPFS